MGSPYGVAGDRPSRPDPATTDGEVCAVSPLLPLLVAVRPLAHAVLCGPLTGSIQYAHPYLHGKPCLRLVTVPLAGCNHTLVSSPHPSNASASSSTASSCFSFRTFAPRPHLPPRCAPGPCLLPTVQAVIGTVSSLLRHPTLAPRVDLDATSSALTAAARTGGGRPFPRHLHDEVVTVLRLMKLRRQGSGGVSAGAAAGETAPSASAVGFA